MSVECSLQEVCGKVEQCEIVKPLFVVDTTKAGQEQASKQDLRPGMIAETGAITASYGGY